MHSSLTIRLLGVAAVLVLALAGSASAQTATALIQAGQEIPGGNAGQTVTSINTSAANHSGGYAFTCNTDDAGATVSTVWGNLAGGTGTVLRREGLYGVYDQQSFETFFGIGETTVAYSPLSNNTDSGSTSLDGVFLNDDPVAVEEEVYPFTPGYWWSFGSRPGVTQDGIPYFVGGITDTQGGSTDNRGLFYGLDAAPRLIGGDMITGLPDPVVTGSAGISFDYRVSALGTHYIAEVGTNTGSTTNDNSMVIDGAVIMIDGMPVTEASPVPAAAGGLPGENWDNFDSEGINENGDYMFTGDTDGATATDEFLLLNGQIVLREGDMIDGYVITGSIESAYMNADGDYAVVWDVLVDGVSKEALFFNGDLMLMEGDPVDVDGDGTPEPGAILAGFTGIASLSIGDRDNGGVVTMYFVGDVDLTPSLDTPVPQPEMGDADELGYEGEIPSPEDRAVRMGFAMPTGQPVATFLTGFTVTPQDGQVQVVWQVQSDGAPVQYHLRARRGVASWDVPYTSLGASSFVATDSPGAGEITYALSYSYPGGPDLLLSERTVSIEVPAGVRLSSAHPNPFNPQTAIKFSLDRPQHVRLSVVDLNGRVVATVADHAYAAGEYTETWTGVDASGQRVASGTYLARLESAAGVRTAKLMLVK